MKYKNIKKYGDEKFRRISGMKKTTFAKAIEILNQKYAEEHSNNVNLSSTELFSGNNLGNTDFYGIFT